MRRGIAYPVELRERVVKVCELERSHTWEEAAELFGVGVATVNRWVALFRRTGSVVPRPHGGGQPLRVDDEKVREVVEAHRDATREDLAAAYARRTGVTVSAATIGRSLARLGFTRKKRRWFQPSGTARPSSRRASASRKRSAPSPRADWSSSTRPARTSR